MKRVLIITPNWPPITYPDMQRVRMALPYMEEFGWQPLILRCDPSEQGGYKEAKLCETIPPGTRTWQASTLPRWLTRGFGLSSYGLRSLPSLMRLGRKIIRTEKPDLVFFSTVLFPLTTLGPLWRKGYGVPYVLDFQDRWVPENRNDPFLPSGFKARLSRAMDRRLEPLALSRAAHVISVSPSYVQTLSARYPHLKDRDFTVLPFGAPEADFQYLAKNNVPQKIFEPEDGWRHWVYVGRGGADMDFALKAFFIALAQARRLAPVTWNKVRLHFIGTHYAPSAAGSQPIADLAASCGVGDLVEEKTGRIGYLESLRCLMDAEALIVPGSVDAAYTASKVYPYILARKPLLAVFHEKSSVCDVLRQTGAGELVTFSGRDSAEAVSNRIVQRWFERWPPAAPSTDWKAFERYSARAMTLKLCKAFDRAVNGGAS